MLHRVLSQRHPSAFQGRGQGPRVGRWLVSFLWVSRVLLCEAGAGQALAGEAGPPTVDVAQQAELLQLAPLSLDAGGQLAHELLGLQSFWLGHSPMRPSLKFLPGSPEITLGVGGGLARESLPYAAGEGPYTAYYEQNVRALTLGVRAGAGKPLSFGTPSQVSGAMGVQKNGTLALIGSVKTQLYPAVSTLDTQVEDSQDGEDGWRVPTVIEASLAAPISFHFARQSGTPTWLFVSPWFEVVRDGSGAEPATAVAGGLDAAWFRRSSLGLSGIQVRAGVPGAASVLARVDAVHGAHLPHAPVFVRGRARLGVTRAVGEAGDASTNVSVQLSPALEARLAPVISLGVAPTLLMGRSLREVGTDEGVLGGTFVTYFHARLTPGLWTVLGLNLEGARVRALEGDALYRSVLRAEWQVSAVAHF